MTNKNFGWTGYKKLGWNKDNNLHYYQGTFKEDNDPHNFTLIRIRFWSDRPVKAMRYIYDKCNSIKDTLAFNEKELIFYKRF